MSSSASANVATASTQLSVSTARQTMAIRDSRLPTYTRQLLGGYDADRGASDVAALLHATIQLTNNGDICLAVLSAMAVGFTPETLAASHVPLTAASQPGNAAVRALSSTTKTAPQKFIVDTVEIQELIKHKGADVRPTDGDAASMLAMAVFAAGKAPTDENKAGYLGGGPNNIRGRVGALKAAYGATDPYLTGARSLTFDTLQKIHRAFGAIPAARHALFGAVAIALPRPFTTYEAAVASQARLLRSEGKGSFDRAVDAVATFGPALDVLPLFRGEMVSLSRAISALSAEPYVMRTFGYILDRDAYDTVRVGQFARIATLGVMVAQASGSGSAQNIKKPVTDPILLQKIQNAFDVLNAVA